MKRIIGVAMVIDGVLQALAVSAVISTFADRNISDQLLTVAHLGVGAALLFAGRSLIAEESRFHRAPTLVLTAALALSLIETTWFNWTDVAVRAVYTAVALVVVLRKTTLPTT